MKNSLVKLTERRIPSALFHFFYMAGIGLAMFSSLVPYFKIPRDDIWLYRALHYYFENLLFINLGFMLSLVIISLITEFSTREFLSKKIKTAGYTFTLIGIFTASIKIGQADPQNFTLFSILVPSGLALATSILGLFFGGELTWNLHSGYPSDALERVEQAHDALECSARRIITGSNYLAKSSEKMAYTMRNMSVLTDTLEDSFFSPLTKVSETSHSIAQSLIATEKELSSFVKELDKFTTRLKQIQIIMHSKEPQIVLVRIQMDRSIEAFTDEIRESTIVSIAHQIDVATDEIEMVYIIAGSVVMTLKMPEDAALRFMSLYLNRSHIIDELKIEKVELRPILILPSEADSEPFPSLIRTRKTTKILFLSANPSDTARLRIDEEVKRIQMNLKLAKERENLELKQEWAVTAARQRIVLCFTASALQRL